MGKLKFVGNERTTPAWSNEPLNGTNVLPGGAQIDANQYPADGTFTITTTGTAALNATAITVTGASMTGVIPNGTRLDFGGGVVALVTETARPKENGGNVTVKVSALAAAVNSGSTATISGTGAVRILSGTVVGRTYAERDAGTPFGVPADGDDEVYILAFDVNDATQDNFIGLAKPGLSVWEDQLPTFAGLSSTLKGKVRTKYNTGKKYA